MLSCNYWTISKPVSSCRKRVQAPWPWALSILENFISQCSGHYCHKAGNIGSSTGVHIPPLHCLYLGSPLTKELWVLCENATSDAWKPVPRP